MVRIQCPVCMSFYTHWHSLPKQAGGIVPHSRDFLSRPNSALQPFMNIIELLPDGDALVRLHGTANVDAYGRDTTGMRARSISSSPLIEVSLLLWRGIAEKAYGMRSVVTYATAGGRHIKLEVVALPLATDPGRHPRVALFNHVIDRFGHGDTIAALLDVMEREWLDLGAGVPALAPAAFIKTLESRKRTDFSP